MLGVDRHGADVWLALRHQFVEVDLAWAQFGLDAALVPDDVAQRQVLDGLVDDAAQVDGLAAAHADVAGNDDLGAGVDDAVAQRADAHAGVDDRMDRAQPRTGQHGDHAFQRQRHVDDDAVAAFRRPRLRSPLARRETKLAQFVVGDLALAAILGDPDQRHLVAVGAVGVAVQRIEGDVGLAADKPAMIRILPLHHLVPGLEPLRSAPPSSPQKASGSAMLRACSASKSWRLACALSHAGAEKVSSWEESVRARITSEW